MGAQILSSEQLIKNLQSNNSKSYNKTNKEKYQPENIDVDYWLNKFNQSGETNE